MTGLGRVNMVERPTAGFIVVADRFTAMGSLIFTQRFTTVR